MPHRLRRSQLIEFDNVAAGHAGVMSDKSGAVVVKPCHQSEIDFYDTLNAHPDFRPWVPEYIGTLTINPGASAPAAAPPQVQRPAHGPSHSQSARLEPVSGTPIIATVPESWTPSGGRSINAERGVALENVAYGFSKPNILDVKLGARLWADDAPLAKRQKLDRAAEETTSGSMGFRIAGMKTWQGLDAAAELGPLKGYRKHDKFYGRSFTPETVHRGFEEYFFLDRPDAPRNRMRNLIRRFIDNLRGLVAVLENEESRMYSASLLFVYEGDWQALAEKLQIERVLLEEGGFHGAADATEASGEENGPNGDSALSEGVVHVEPPAEESPPSESDSDGDPRLPRIQALKMIDFAHATWTPGQGPDQNVLRGIRGVIALLERLVA